MIGVFHPNYRLEPLPSDGAREPETRIYLFTMKNIKPMSVAAACAASFLLSAPCGSAQDTPAPAPEAAVDSKPADASATPPARGGGDRMEQFRQRMNERLKTALKVNDDEWGIIQPLLEKVQTKMRESMTNRFGFGGGRRGGQGGQGGGDGATGNGGNNGGDRGNRPERPKSPEVESLQKVLDAEGSTPEDIKVKLQAVRDSRKKSAAELEQAQEDLRKVLTQRQEATLVMMGMLQ